MKGLEKIATKM